MKLFIILFLLLALSLPVYAGAAASPQARRAMKEKKMRAMGIQPSQSSTATGAKVQKLQYADIDQIKNPNQTQMQAEEDVPNIKQTIENFKKTSGEWNLIKSDSTKRDVIAYFISEFDKRDIEIKKRPEHYVFLINDMLAKQPQLASQPLDSILQLVAIIEYDFDNGQDKDSLARKVLGESSYQNNRKRLGLE